MSDKPIYVTQPYLPPLEEFIPYLEQIWGSKILTNGGPFHKQLEQMINPEIVLPMETHGGSPPCITYFIQNEFAEIKERKWESRKYNEMDFPSSFQHLQ